MENFYTIDIIGGTNEHRGCKYDDVETLVNSYLSLLIEALTNGGIVYSTGRNGTLARIELDAEKGFINYVQPSIGKWNYTDVKYQRVVSPEFVLYMFNNNCLKRTFESVQARNDILNKQMKFNSKNQSIDGTFFKDLNMETIIKRKNEYQEEYFKKQNGEPNSFDRFNSNEIRIVSLLYEIIKNVIKYSKDFSDFQTNLEIANNLREKINNDTIAYSSLTEQQQMLVDELYDDEDYYMSLGFFNNSIRKQVAKHLVKIQKQKRRLSKLGGDISSISAYDDPVSIIDGEAELEFDYFGDDSFTIIVDYSNAKEFSSQNIINVASFKRV